MKTSRLLIVIQLIILSLTVTTPPIYGGDAAAAGGQAKVYVCPECGQECDKLTFDKPGKCPGCGMPLVEKGADKEKPVTVAVLLFDGVEIIDYSGPWEVFGEAGFKVHTVAEKPEPVHAVFGQQIVPDYTFSNSPPADILLVPGGSVTRAVRNAALIKWVQSNAASARHVMSVCSGAFILGRAGLLDGLTATTVSHAIDELSRACPKAKVVYDQRFVDNGKIITTAGLSSGIDGAFHLLSKINGRGVAQATALGMEYRWDPDSKFARAALADRYFPDIDNFDGKVLSTNGDLDSWEMKVVLSKPSSAAEVINLIAKQVGSGIAHVHSVTPGSVTTDASGSKSEMSWTFRDENNRAWRGQGVAELSNDQPGKVTVTLKVAREPEGKAT